MNIGKTIIVIDDDEDDRFIIRHALETEGVDLTIIEFDSGQDFLSSVADFKNQPSVLVLLDINMPRMNGLEVLASLKLIPDCKHIPVVIISTASSPQQVQQAYSYGALDYFTKPQSVNEVKILIKKFDQYFS